jgi:hypothetical protein
MSFEISEIHHHAEDGVYLNVYFKVFHSDGL